MLDEKASGNQIDVFVFFLTGGETDFSKLVQVLIGIQLFLTPLVVITHIYILINPKTWPNVFMCSPLFYPWSSERCCEGGRTETDGPSTSLYNVIALDWGSEGEGDTVSLLPRGSWEVVGRKVDLPLGTSLPVHIQPYHLLPLPLATPRKSSSGVSF